MRIIIFIFLLTPFLSNAQKTEVYIKLTTASGQPIQGDATLKGFEKAMGPASLSMAGKNNTQLTLTIPVCGGVAQLKRALTTGQVLPNGQITAVTFNPSLPRAIFLYTINLEKITLLSCGETMDNDKVTSVTVTLQAARIGWTYYSNSEKPTPPEKFGWDAETKSEWTNF